MQSAVRGTSLDDCVISDTLFRFNLMRNRACLVIQQELREKQAAEKTNNAQRKILPWNGLHFENRLLIRTACV